MPPTPQPALRQTPEDYYKDELAALRRQDDGLEKPPGWLLTPRSVVHYLMGGDLADGTPITAKYIGDRRLMEVAVATLTTNRALLLSGVPGTAKTWVSEHLAAAISGDSALLIQGTAGINEDALRYGWNYAELISKGPSEIALVASPIMRAMEDGKIVRLEELTRIPGEVQDSLITILSEKTLPVPELNLSVQAVPGFNLIATANERDRGTNELSTALRRRFNTVILPAPVSLDEELRIVRQRSMLARPAQGKDDAVMLAEVSRLLTIFRELREGRTLNGDQKLATPSSGLSTAEAISIVNNALSLARHFGNGRPGPGDFAPSMRAAIVRDTERDTPVWRSYVEGVVRSRRKEWPGWYECLSEFDASAEEGD